MHGHDANQGFQTKKKIIMEKKYWKYKQFFFLMSKRHLFCIHKQILQSNGLKMNLNDHHGWVNL